MDKDLAFIAEIGGLNDKLVRAEAARAAAREQLGMAIRAVKEVNDERHSVSVEAQLARDETTEWRERKTEWEALERQRKEMAAEVLRASKEA